MCELLVAIADRTSDDPYLDAQMFKRGDVIDVRDDGALWGAGESSHPEWAILRLPRVSRQVGDAMLGGEIDTDPASPSYVLQRRAFSLDLDALARKRNVTDAVFTSFKRRKPQLADPNILG